MIKTVIGSLTLFALGWIAWPYYAVYDFADAIQRGDQVALEHRVAWDDVRRGLRDDFNALFLQSLGKNEGAGSALGTGLAVLLGPTIINNAIDNYVTPGGIAAAIRSGKVSIPSAAQIGSSSVNQAPATTLDVDTLGSQSGGGRHDAQRGDDCKARWLAGHASAPHEGWVAPSRSWA